MRRHRYRYGTSFHDLRWQTIRDWAAAVALVALVCGVSGMVAFFILD